MRSFAIFPRRGPDDWQVSLDPNCALSAKQRTTAPFRTIRTPLPTGRNRERRGRHGPQVLIRQFAIQVGEIGGWVPTVISWPGIVVAIAPPCPLVPLSPVSCAGNSVAPPCGSASRRACFSFPSTRSRLSASSRAGYKPGTFFAGYGDFRAAPFRRYGLLAPASIRRHSPGCRRRARSLPDASHMAVSEPRPAQVRDGDSATAENALSQERSRSWTESWSR